MRFPVPSCEGKRGRPRLQAEFRQRPTRWQGGLRDGRGCRRLPNTLFADILWHTQKSTIFPPLFIWVLYLSLFIYVGTYIRCIFTNKHAPTVRDEGVAETHNAPPAPARPADFCEISCAADAPPRSTASRTRQHTLLMLGRGAMSLKVKGHNPFQEGNWFLTHGLVS